MPGFGEVYDPLWSPVGTTEGTCGRTPQPSLIPLPRLVIGEPRSPQERGEAWRVVTRVMLTFSFAVVAVAASAIGDDIDDPDGPAETTSDPLCDVVARRTDPSADGPFDPAAHRLIDLLAFTIRTWAPTAPASNLFTGSFEESGDFVCLDLVLDGLVNPPGSVDPLDFRPFSTTTLRRFA